MPLRRSDVVADVVELLDQLGIDRAAWSAGPEVDRTHWHAEHSPRIVSLPSRPCVLRDGRTPKTTSRRVWELVQLVAQDPVGHREAVRSRCRWLAEDPHQLLRMTERLAPSVLEAPGMRAAYVAWMAESAAVSTEGYVDDWLMECYDDGWGFELGDVCAPVFCWFGELDQVVPPFHAGLLADKVPTSHIFGCPECGHFVPIAHWPEILEQLIASSSDA